ncbi:MAG TPA: hypothetical protein VM712_03230, partial [Gaiellales bacterium]|nr:hypothetical protein [Gaiellales bacterium]
PAGEPPRPGQERSGEDEPQAWSAAACAHRARALAHLEQSAGDSSGVAIDFFGLFRDKLAAEPKMWCHASLKEALLC